MYSTRGFSLLELLIVMAIVAILMITAYPVYTAHLIKGRRNQAEIDLLYLGSQLESFYSLENTYQSATLDALGVNLYTDDQNYQLAILSATEAHYEVAAIPLKTDTQCGTLTLNEQGEKSSSGTLTTTSCWN